MSTECRSRAEYVGVPNAADIRNHCFDYYYE